MNYIHTFKKRERKTRVWIAVDRGRLRITAFKVGGGKSSVLRKLINKIGENNLKTVYTDGNFCYEEELGKNADIKHIVSKSDLLSGELRGASPILNVAPVFRLFVSANSKFLSFETFISLYICISIKYNIP